MVLSLAFILAFIGSAVALLIGIIIFSEVQGDMLQTFEVIQVGNEDGEVLTTGTHPLGSNYGYVCDSPVDGNNTIHPIDKDTGLGDAEENPTLDKLMVISGGLGFGSSGCTGMAQDPTDKQWYIVARQVTGSSQDGWLAKIDPTTGIGSSLFCIGGTECGDYGTNSIAFDSTGQLYGYANLNALFPDHVFEIDKLTGAIGKTCEYQSGFNQPAVIAYNWSTDELVIFAKAGSAGEMEIVDRQGSNFTVLGEELCDSTVANIDFSDSSWEGATTMGFPQSMTYHSGDDLFYANTQDSSPVFTRLITITPSAPFVSVVIANMTFINTDHGDPKRGIGFELDNLVGVPILERQVPDSFNQASNIAFTVVGILPVALFFALFAIFGGRTE